MKNFRQEIRIDAPQSRVWTILADLEGWSSWTASIDSVEVVGARPVGRGSEVIVCQPKLPKARWKVTAWDPPRGFVWVSEGPGFRTTADHILDEQGDATKLTLTVAIEGWLGALLAPLVGGRTRRYLGMEAAGLKQRSEAQE